VVAHLIEVVGELGGRGIELVVLDQGIDTTSPGGRLLFHVLAAMSEFVGDLISENTKDGLAAARARGRVGGRPSVMTPGKLRVARQMIEDGEHHHRDRPDHRRRPGDGVPPPDDNDSLTLPAVEVRASARSTYLYRVPLDPRVGPTTQTRRRSAASCGARRRFPCTVLQQYNYATAPEPAMPTGAFCCQSRPRIR